MKYYEMILIAVYQIDLQHVALTLKLIEIIKEDCFRDWGG